MLAWKKYFTSDQKITSVRRTDFIFVAEMTTLLRKHEMIAKREVFVAYLVENNRTHLLK